MKRFLKGILFFAITWIVITILTVLFHYFFFRPEDYEGNLIEFFIVAFEPDLIIIFFIWGLLTVLSILAYWKIKSGN